MLNKGNSNILKQRNEETLECYPDIKLSHFWSSHKDKIMNKIFDELKEDSNYDTARKLVDINEMTINVYKQIPIFIEMLNKGNDEILKRDNKETLEGYSNIKLANFWSSHKERITQKLFVELKNNSKYDTARNLIELRNISTTFLAVSYV